MRFGSLFSGIGGFDLGFEQAGLECAWQVEIDADCRRVLAARFQSASDAAEGRNGGERRGANRSVPRIHANVREVGRHNLEPVDLVCGGFPCQDLSVAGRRAGLAGERSGLWHEFHRILAELRPRLVVVENVPGLLSSNGGRDMAVVLRGLAELGYGWAYRVFDAQYAGVPQRRRRVFIVGCLDGPAGAAKVLFEPESCGWNPAPRREAREAVAGGVGEGPALCLRAQGNSPHRADAMTYMPTVAPTMPSFNGPRGTTTNPQFTDQAIIAGALQERDYKGADSDTKPGHLIATQVDGSEQAATLRGFGHGWQGQHNTTNAVIVGAGEGSGREADGPIPDERNLAAPTITHTLKAEGHDVSEDGTGRGVPLTVASTLRSNWRNNSNPAAEARMHVQQGMAVRRLLPLECLRLMGFPDDWFDGLGLSDSAKYRMCGNAVVVNVSRWIGRRLMENRAHLSILIEETQ